MIHVCIMSGHEGRLRLEKKVYLTFMGGQELTRPTVARQILAQRHRPKEAPERPNRQFFLTVMGGVEIKSPTLAEEFLDLREMLRSEALGHEDWERALADISRYEVHVSSFTLMGALEENTLPTEEEEIDSLALQRHLGNISDRALQVLQTGIGLRDAERRSAVRRAMLADA